MTIKQKHRTHAKNIKVAKMCAKTSYENVFLLKFSFKYTISVFLPNRTCC